MFFTIPYFLERMLEDPFSPLTLLSISAIITTISLFFCGIPICLQIFRRGSTHEISGFPFLMGFLGGVFWLRYGFLKSDLTMITVNSVGVSLMTLYLFFYLYFSRPRSTFIVQLTVVASFVSSMLVLVHIYQMDSIKCLGFVCMTFNIMNFGAPLAGLVLPPRSYFGIVVVPRFLCRFVWPICSSPSNGVCTEFVSAIFSLFAGMLLATFQISLFLVLPRRAGTNAPLAKCCRCLRDLENSNGQQRRGEKGDSARRPARTAVNKFLHRQRVVDKRMIPSSRAACIAFLRANAFDVSGGSVTSRSTADSWMSNSLSRVSSHSHPELWLPAGVIERADGEGADTLYTVDSTANLRQNLPPGLAAGPNTSLLSSFLQQSPSTVYANQPIYDSDRSREVDDDVIRLRDDDRDLIIRTLSAPDLAQQQQRPKLLQEERLQQQSE
uniref:Sugar transporter SWEET1 n=1 Tax=Globodera pallida TaxID=36090 RepID=A0A183C9Q1_GLOPA